MYAEHRCGCAGAEYCVQAIGNLIGKARVIDSIAFEPAAIMISLQCSQDAGKDDAASLPASARLGMQVTDRVR